MVKEQLKILAGLANSDNNIHEREMNLMIKIGEAHGMEHDEIMQIIENPGTVGDLGSLSDDDKFEFLYSLVQLMKVDDEVFNEEVLYCQEIAMKLGYEFGAIMELYPHVHKNMVIPSEKKMLKKKLMSFLKDGS